MQARKVANAGEIRRARDRRRLCRWGGGLWLLVACAAPAPRPAPVAVPTVRVVPPRPIAKKAAAPTPATTAEVTAALERAFAEAQSGRAAQARALEDEAAGLLERATGRSLRASVPSVDGDTRNYWTQDGEWLLTVSELGELWLRQRGAWYPRFRTTAEIQGYYGYAGADTFAGFSSVSGPQQLTLLDVTPSPSFGNVRAKYTAFGEGVWFGVRGAFDDSVVFSEAVAADAHFSVSVASLRTGAVAQRVEWPLGVRPLAVSHPSADGRRLVVTWPEHLSLVDLQTGKVSNVKAKADTAYNPLSPNARFALWSEPMPGGKLHRTVVYDVEQGKARKLAPSLCSVRHRMQFDSGSRFVAVVSGAGVACLIELATARTRTLGTVRNGWASPQGFGPGDETLVVYWVGQEEVWSVATARLTSRRELPPMSHDGSVACQYADGVAGGARVTDAHLPVVCDAQSEKPVSGSPQRFALGVQLLRSGGLDVEANGKRWSWRADRSIQVEKYESFGDFGPGCEGDRVWKVEPLGELGLEPLNENGTEQVFVECANGKRLESFMVPYRPQALIDRRHVLISDGAHDLELWDIEARRAIAKLPSLDNERAMLVAALSPRRRYLFLERSVIDVSTSKKIADLPISDRGTFVGDEALVTEHTDHLDVYRAPSFKLVAQIYFAYDAGSAIAIEPAADGGIAALEVLGPPEAWDTTLDCGIGLYGVPFRICRERLTKPGLLAAALAGGTP